MKGYQSILLLSLYFSAASCNYAAKPHQTGNTSAKKAVYSSNTIEDVSLITLIANPRQFDGHKVRIIGYLNLEFEGNCIYLRKEDYDQAISKNGLWVDIDRSSEQLPDEKQCVKKYVLMEGTFDANNLGHMGMNSGAIRHIRRLEVWEPMVDKPRPKVNNIRFPPAKARL